MTDYQSNRLALLAVGLVAAILTGFAVSLIGSKTGEIASALGSVVGGAIGALGAALAVYLTLKGQREEETLKASNAIFMEVAQLCKFPIEQLGTCQLIHTGQFTFPKAKLPALMETPQPIIYPAIADRISRLPRPALVVAFYTGLMETRGTVAVITNSPPEDEPIRPQHIEGLAVLLINQCQLARSILRSVQPDPEREAALVVAMLAEITEMLDERLTQAEAMFPSVQAYQDRTNI